MNVDRNRRVFVVLGLYRPDPELLSRQLESLVSQSHRNMEVLVCADGPQDADGLDVVRGFADRAVRLVEFDARVGVHANFARGLREALVGSRSDTDLFAFSDQDDVWSPDKLERQVASFADPQTSLCHSDARIVSREGEVLVESLFEHEARLRTSAFIDLLLMNSVTGMTAVFRRDVALAAEPFPMSGCRYILHDHWVALVASLLGGIRFIDAPLVDYTQHSSNVMGARPWAGSLPRALLPAARRTYLRKCYRQYLWRRKALQELGRALGRLPSAGDLSGASVRALFECDAGRSAGLALSLDYRMHGRWRQADQLWRIWRGKSLYCSSAKHSKR